MASAPDVYLLAKSSPPGDELSVETLHPPTSAMKTPVEKNTFIKCYYEIFGMIMLK